MFRRDLLSDENSYPCYLKRYCLNNSSEKMQKAPYLKLLQKHSLKDKENLFFNQNRTIDVGKNHRAKMSGEFD